MLKITFENYMSFIEKTMKIKLFSYQKEFLKQYYKNFLKNKKEEKNMKEFVIVGDTETSQGCLVCLCGADYKRACEILERILYNPTPNDLLSIKGHSNLRIEEVASENCWWHGNLD